MDDDLDRFIEFAEHAPELGRDEERALARAALEHDDDARKQLIEANLRLVVRVARTKAADRAELGELMNAGNVGLVRAVDKFRPEGHDYRLTTYATWWIRQAIDEHIARRRA